MFLAKSSEPIKTHYKTMDISLCLTDATNL
nr:MAG TPA: hypothetical protein [Caudoviricetes sp.]